MLLPLGKFHSRFHKTETGTLAINQRADTLIKALPQAMLSQFAKSGFQTFSHDRLSTPRRQPLLFGLIS
jgi:hypothetical protein